MGNIEWRMGVAAPHNFMVSVLEMDDATHDALGGNGEIEQIETILSQLSHGRGRFVLALKSTASDRQQDTYTPPQFRSTYTEHFQEDTAQQFAMQDYTGGGTAKLWE